MARTANGYSMPGESYDLEKDLEKTDKEMKEMVHARYSVSNLRMMYEGTGAKPADIDVAVNTFTVVNTLVLTIPFGLVGSLNQQFWDW